MACRTQLAIVVDVADITRCPSEAGRTLVWCFAHVQVGVKRCRPVPQILGELRNRIFANSARPIQLTAADLGDVLDLEKLTLSQPRANTEFE